jgi:peptidoglycan hydrolase CwlO-like protein
MFGFQKTGLKKAQEEIKKLKAEINSLKKPEQKKPEPIKPEPTNPEPTNPEIKKTKN